jgi:LysR family transcriptional regulator, transcriptional activator of the cysJI operon
MYFEQLRAFCDLAETRSFTQAAQINQLTQSAVSLMLRAFERQFNAPLVVRGKGTAFHLTPQGEAFYIFSKDVLREYDTLQLAIQIAREATSNLVRFACISSFGVHDLPLVLKKFLANNSAAKVELTYGTTEHVCGAVLEGSADLGLVACPCHLPELQLIPLREDPLVVICAKTHPFADSTSIPLRMLNGQKFISLQRDLPTAKAILRLLDDHNISVQAVHELDNFELIKRAVEAGSELAIVPEQTVQQELVRRTLAIIPIEDVPLSRSLALIHKPNKTLTPTMNALIALLQEPVSSTPKP